MIRTATLQDAKAIRDLLDNLGYRASPAGVEKNLEVLLIHPDHHVLVYDVEAKVAGFIALYLVPSLAVDDGLAIINYLAVNEQFTRQGIGKALEGAALAIAWENGCDRMQVHCRAEREQAQGFYKSRGYREYPVFFQKRLIYAE